MRTILVSGASGVIGYGILRSLRDLVDCTLIGTTIYNDSVAQGFCDVFEQAPRTDDDHYMDWLRGIIKKHRVDMIIPGIEIDVQTWSDGREEIAETGASALLNTAELITLCSDKWHFYERLHGTGSPLAIETRLAGTFDELQDQFGLPFLLKPRKGSASRGIVKVENREDFEPHAPELGSVLMAQPIVGSHDAEYTTSAFFDDKSNLRCLQSLRRNLGSEGFTQKAEVVDLPEAKSAILELAQYFKPVGPTNFQFRLHEGQLKLLEINPRISSATSIRAGFGYNESVMSVEYFLDGKVPAQPNIKRGYAVRYAEDRFFYDRTII